MKVCRKCAEEKSLSEYYTHKMMKDGHLNICMGCTKARVTLHREKNINEIRKYDRKRGKLPRRKRTSIANTRRIRRNRDGYAIAHSRLARAIKKKLITKPKQCSACSSARQIEGHHEDYFKPLEVVWLCSACHKQLHLGKSEQAKELRARIAVPF